MLLEVIALKEALAKIKHSNLQVEAESQRSRCAHGVARVARNLPLLEKENLAINPPVELGVSTLELQM